MNTFRHIAAWCVGGLWLLGNCGQPAAAQAPAPGGAALREVTRLERVPEPPGGLIPYRVGKLWGYADTTGRLVIAPCFEADYIQEAPLFDHGFVINQAGFHASAIRPLPNRPLDFSSQTQNHYTFSIVNVRGDLLRVRRSEVAVLRPDSSLQLVPRAQAHGKLALEPLMPLDLPFYGDIGFKPSTFLRVRAKDDLLVTPLPVEASSIHPESLGVNRVTWSAKTVGENSHWMARSARRQHHFYALSDLQGRRLTGYRFSSIEPFSEGLAVVKILVKEAKQVGIYQRDPPEYRYGYIDTVGRMVIPAIYKQASAFCQGRAVVSTKKRTGIIDTRGHYLLRLQNHYLFGPDQAGYIIEAMADRHNASTEDPYSAYSPIRYLPPPGQPNLVSLYTNGEGFSQGRAVVWQGGLGGLIDQAGNWVAKPLYSWLYTPQTLYSQPNELASYDPPEDVEEWRTSPVPLPRYPAPDSGYLVARRDHKYGIVARQSGREVVPAIYDSISFNPYQGMACMQRDGQDYLVSVDTGHEVAGTYQGIDFITPEGRCLYLTRNYPAAWALADTTAQLRTTWIPGTGYPTPWGWLISHESNRWTLYTATGQLARSSAVPITQPKWDNIWSKVQQDVMEISDIYLPYWRLSLNNDDDYTQGVFLLADSARHQLRILDAKLCELTPIPLPRTNSKQFLQTLQSGWSYAHPPNHPREVSQDASAFDLYTDTGQLLIPPPIGVDWANLPSFDYSRAWRKHGVLPTTKGYLTRGRRQLWTD